MRKTIYECGCTVHDGNYCLEVCPVHGKKIISTQSRNEVLLAKVKAVKYLNCAENLELITEIENKVPKDFLAQDVINDFIIFQVNQVNQSIQSITLQKPIN